MTRIYVPLDKNMTDEEIVQALKDAAAKHSAEEKAREEFTTHPMSQGQKALWFIYQMDRTSSAKSTNF